MTTSAVEDLCHARSKLERNLDQPGAIVALEKVHAALKALGWRDWI